MFYHDHSYGITRLNVYAWRGRSRTVLRDPVEQKLVNGGTFTANGAPVTVPAGTIPTDADPARHPGQDVRARLTTSSSPRIPTWDKPHWGGQATCGSRTSTCRTRTGSLVQGGVNAHRALGLQPVVLPARHRPDRIIRFPNPLYNGGLNGEPPMNPDMPIPTIVPEAFMDTPIVNGTAYPVLKVQRKAYRFRILNAANDRMWNLQLYYAKSNGQMWGSGVASQTLLNGDAGEVPMISPHPRRAPTLPPTWPHDGRDGGVPADERGRSVVHPDRQRGRVHPVRRGAAEHARRLRVLPPDDHRAERHEQDAVPRPCRACRRHRRLLAGPRRHEPDHVQRRPCADARVRLPLRLLHRRR